MDAIRNNKPYNEVKRGVEASLVTSMGRMAAHTGQEITFDEMLNSDQWNSPPALTSLIEADTPIVLPGMPRACTRGRSRGAARRGNIDGKPSERRHRNGSHRCFCLQQS